MHADGDSERAHDLGSTHFVCKWRKSDCVSRLNVFVVNRTHRCSNDACILWTNKSVKRDEWETSCCCCRRVMQLLQQNRETNERHQLLMNEWSAASFSSLVYKLDDPAPTYSCLHRDCRTTVAINSTRQFCYTLHRFHLITFSRILSSALVFVSPPSCLHSILMNLLLVNTLLNTGQCRTMTSEMTKQRTSAFPSADGWQRGCHNNLSPSFLSNKQSIAAACWYPIHVSQIFPDPAYTLLWLYFVFLLLFLAFTLTVCNKLWCEAQQTPPPAATYRMILTC